jgi:putative FmdB family regulatory protein
MPIFEYQCLKCGYHFETVPQPGTTRETTCPECGSDEVKKELSAFSTGSSSACFRGG